MSFECSHISGRKFEGGAAVVVYGLDPIPGQLDRTIAALSEEGDVFTYKYPSDVVTGGDPHALPDLVGRIKDDIRDKTDGMDPERIRMAGASLGAFVAYNIQMQLDLPLPGLYTSAGVNVARNIMYNPIFYPVRKMFRNNGVGIDELDTAWQYIDIYRDRPGTVPAVCAISRFDPVVPYPLAARNLRAWQHQGARIKVLPNSVVSFEHSLLHTAAINYFDGSIREIIDISSSI